MVWYLTVFFSRGEGYGYVFPIRGFLNMSLEASVRYRYILSPRGARYAPTYYRNVTFFFVSNYSRRPFLSGLNG